MAYTVDILNQKKVEANGLLSKIQIGGKTYEVKDLIARENIGTLSAGLDAVAADLAALSYVKATGQFADDAAIKSYVDAQVGAINKFDVHVMAEGEALPTASAETMYILYLKPDVNAASGAYLEYITVKNGENYNWEQIGSTEMDVTGFVTETALNKALEPYAKTADLGDLAAKNEADLDLKALAHKDSATGTVASETISGVKATGTSTGSINVALTETEADIASTGSYTPAGSVDGGKVTAAGEVKITITNADAQASLSTADYQPAGDVSVTLSNNEINAVKSVGTQASFKEGAFTPAALDHAEVSANYVEEGLVGAVEDETLTFTPAAVKALSASKVNSFSGGAKAADTFVANELPVAEMKTVGVQAATFEGAVASGLKVTGVTYQTHDVASATFTGSEVAVTGASFSGNAATIEVAGKGKAYAVDAANTKFNGAAIELAVGDIVVAEKSVTVQ